MTAPTEQKDPSYPFIKFKKMKNFSTKEDVVGKPAPTYTFMKVTGCHNQVPSVMHWIKGGHVPVSYGNLTGKQAEVKSLIDTYLGRSIDPALAAFDADVMDKKIKAARDSK